MSVSLKIKVSVVEDDDKIRESLVALIDGSDGFCCVGACRTAEDACKQIPQAKPDVVLMDIKLPQMSGVECVRKLKGLVPSMKIVMHTVYEDEDQLFRSLRAGAHGYLLKRTPPAKLLESITEVYQGYSPISGQIARMMVDFFHQRGGEDESVEKLTKRETEILELLSKGYHNKEIADMLGIGFDTVRSHLRNIYEKLHVNTRAEAVMKYFGR